MRVLFMGTPAFAATSLQALLDAGHDVAAVVTRPDAPSGRGLKSRPPAVKELAGMLGLPILQPESVKESAFTGQVEAKRPDITVVVAYGRMLPPRLLELAPLGAVNVHASLLPRYRGAAPVAWAIARGEVETGVTTMRMVSRMDAGDILLQRSTPIGPEETAGQLEGRLAGMGAQLLVQTLAELAKGDLTPVPQDEAAASYAPPIKKEDGLIDWSRPAPEIVLAVRAFNPWPGARARRAVLPGRPGGLLVIWKAREAAAPAPERRPGEVLGPGNAEDTAEPGVLIACGGRTSLLAVDLQPEGRRRMPAIEALSGRHIKVGDLLGGR